MADFASTHSTAFRGKFASEENRECFEIFSERKKEKSKKKKRMKLYVGNLGDDGNITSSDLRPLFEQYGQVTECECIKNYA